MNIKLNLASVKLPFIVPCLFSFTVLFGQQNPSTQQAELEQLKKEILILHQDVETIQVNLGKAENKFKRGIGMATLGYSVTIAGGLMLGRKNDDLGKALLVSGGVIGITGTVLMVDAFKYLGRASRKQQR